MKYVVFKLRVKLEQIKKNPEKTLFNKDDAKRNAFISELEKIGDELEALAKEDVE
ncbi:MAG: hypothetical protein OEY88_07815 [Candidatus Bathyarchaeota archaeon]|nr:hypothetical protein [Candidatus Bathyarchaeota archaeon]